jgi:hypothetical protein
MQPPENEKVNLTTDKIAKLKASTEDVKAQADQELRRNLEIRASFYEKLTTLDAGSIAVAVSVGIALLSKGTSNSASLHSNLGWLAAIGFFLWSSLICAILHNVIYVRIAHLQAEKASEWAMWIGLINASTMASIAGSPGTGESLSKIINDTFHDRIQKGAMNQQLTEQSVLRVMILGRVAVTSFVIAYSLIFASILRIWWSTR